MTNAHTSGRIVVGVDGSPSSIQAIKWAVAQAGLTNASVDAVIAWHYPNLYGGYAVEDLDWEANAKKTIEAALSTALDGKVDNIATSVTEGYPPKVLVDASVGADLLVVGNRGHSEFAEILLGSVSQHVVIHASCPVLVMRANAQLAQQSA